VGQPALERLISALKSKVKAGTLPLNVREALRRVLDYIEQGRANVYMPHTIQADFDYPSVISLEYSLCPSCRKIYSRDVSSTLKCPSCKSPLIQAYVGAPVEIGIKNVTEVAVPPPSRNGQDYIVLPTDRALHIRCPHSKLLKGVKPERPERPLYTLRFTCPSNDKSCSNYDDGFCRDHDGSVFFPDSGGIKRAIALPGEGLTKSYSEVVFKELREEKDLTRDFNEGLYPDAFSKVCLGEFKVYALTLFYLIGHSYASRGRRLAALAVYRGGEEAEALRVAGRSMTTFGLLFRLNPSKINEIVERLKSFAPVDIFTVAHSVAHAAMKAVVMLSGLSYREFGEAVYLGDKQPEVLIYDDSPGGVGGVKTVGESPPDFISHLKHSASPCPRACRGACRACLYLENCGSLNFMLNWMAVNSYLLAGWP